MSRKIFEDVLKYLQQAEQNGIKYDLRHESTFKVSGAAVYEDAAVHRPDSHVPKMGVVEGRYLDVIAWAVQQKGFYRDGEFGSIEIEQREVNVIPINHSLDVLLR